MSPRNTLHGLLLPLLLLLPFLGACTGVRTLSEPVVHIKTSGGEELGVCTDYGLVFLGRSARSGPAEVTSWFGDGPSIEKVVIEPVGGPIYTASTEIRLPDCTLEFRSPKAGETLWVHGRDAAGPWKEKVVVLEDPRLFGLVTTVPDRLRGHPEYIGAGVFVVPEEREHEKRLAGLVSGRILLQTKDGEREYLAVVGPEHLWRLVARGAPDRKGWIYREDIL
jgi:hypothetical protein